VLMQVEHDKVIYKINYLSSKSSLIQEIRLGDLLNSVERSGVDNEQYNNNIDNSIDNNTYQSVILDDLGKNNSAQGKTTAQMNSREKALDSLDKPDSKIDTANDAQTTQTVPPVEQEKIVEQLLPELEYWLAR